MAKFQILLHFGRCCKEILAALLACASINVVYFSYFSGITDNTCPESHVVLLVKLGRWGGGMEIETIYHFNYNNLDIQLDPY